MLETPRERFVPEGLATLAYSDAALEVGRGGSGEIRRLLPPMILARMIQAAQVGPRDHALDIAGGGGYGAALLAGLGASALAVEDAPELTERAGAAFASLGIPNAQAETGSLRNAGGAAGPFEVILVNGAVESSPEELLSLLAEGGRLLAILKEPGDRSEGAPVAALWRKSGSRFGRSPLFNAAAPTLPDFVRPRTFSF
jgi:protein-L-isoaspartate(D-aspartate) O-methyltransferase